MLQTVNSGSYSNPGLPLLSRQAQLWKRKSPHKSRGAPRRSLGADLLTLYPESVVVSSDKLGWQDIRAIHLHHSSAELHAPTSDNHCIILNLGAILYLNARSGKRNFEGTVHVGETAIIPGGSSWSARSEGPHARNILLMYLRPLFVRNAVTGFNFSYKEVALTPQIGFKQKHIRHIAMSLLYALNEANVVGRLYADSLAVGLAMQMVRRYSTLSDLQVGQGGIPPYKLRKALGLIDLQIAEETEGRIALRSVAQQIGMSYFHFSRAFKQSMGMSPTNYIAERRIEQAKKLLEETELPISDIALRAGYSSQSHFTTAFRRLAGATPKVFRASI